MQSHHAAAPASARASSSPALVPALSRALTLLDRLAQRREPMSLARLASELALPKSSVHGLCNTLLRYGYLQRQDDGAFRIGPGVMPLAEAFVSSTGITQEFNALWAGEGSPEETVILSVLNGRDVVYIGARNGRRPLGLAFNVGMRLPAHLAATGKAMLAFHAPAAVRELFAGDGLTSLTARRAPSLEELLDELAATRTRGYSIDDEGVRAGVYCFGAPVFDAAGQPVAGVGVCIHKSALGPDGGAEHREAVQRTAAMLTQRLGGRLPHASRSA